MLTVERLCKTYVRRGGWFGRDAQPVRAVDDVGFTIAAGETLALVGESGCGKSTVGRMVLNLLPASSGQVWYRGRAIQGLPPEAMRPLRRELQIVFQDPLASLNPRMTVGEILAEPLLQHGLATRREVAARVDALLAQVGMDGAVKSRYPHAFSGGQRQRIGIARALSMQPRLIVCDEAVSALDVSIQAQILNLLQDLQRQRGMAYLFISHDLSVVRQISHRVAVMYMGRLVEVGPTDVLFAAPRHPYTRALLASVPLPDPAARRPGPAVRGEAPTMAQGGAGCAFRSRCPHAQPVCATETPALAPAEGGHAAACHLQETLPPFPPLDTPPDTPARRRLARLAAAFGA